MMNHLGEPYMAEIHSVASYEEDLLKRSDSLRRELGEAETNGADAREIAILHARLQVLTADYLSLVVGLLRSDE